MVPKAIALPLGHPPVKLGWEGRTRTCSLRVQSAALRQLSYFPVARHPGFEPGPFPLTAERTTNYPSGDRTFFL